jgi:hypothetical protein
MVRSEALQTSLRGLHIWLRVSNHEAGVRRRKIKTLKCPGLALRDAIRSQVYAA